jgi:hypothetical protein
MKKVRGLRKVEKPDQITIEIIVHGFLLHDRDNRFVALCFISVVDTH